MERTAYEIHASGNVPARVLEDFEGVTVTIDPGGSTIRADLADEAEDPLPGGNGPSDDPAPDAPGV